MSPHDPRVGKVSCDNVCVVLIVSVRWSKICVPKCRRGWFQDTLVCVFRALERSLQAVGEDPPAFQLYDGDGCVLPNFCGSERKDRKVEFFLNKSN